MVISEIELSAKKILKIHLDNVNGVRFGHIRIWVRTNSFATLKPSTKGFGFDIKYLDEIIKALITLKAIDQSYRSIAQGHLKKKQKFYVYIGQLQKEFANTKAAKSKNPNADPNKTCLYVGYSTKPPRERWKQHLTKARTKNGYPLYSKKAAKWGENYIHWKKFKKYNPIYSTTADKAKNIEKSLAKKFRDKGHTVWSDMLKKEKKPEKG